MTAVVVTVIVAVMAMVGARRGRCKGQSQGDRSRSEQSLHLISSVTSRGMAIVRSSDPHPAIAFPASFSDALESNCKRTAHAGKKCRRM
jgi:hypothetical protein